MRKEIKMTDSTQTVEAIDGLVSVLDEHINFFCQRIEFSTRGQVNKAKFIDEKILPVIDRKVKQQINECIKLALEVEN